MNVPSRRQFFQEVPDPVLDEPRYLFGDVADAAGLAPATLKAWISDGRAVIPFGEYDKPPMGKGTARVFTFRQLVAVAVTTELVRLGIAPARAGATAYSITDMNSEIRDWRDGDTVLIAFAASERFMFGSKSTLSLADIFCDRTPDKSDDRTSFVCVDFDAVLEKVKSRLASRESNV